MPSRCPARFRCAPSTFCRVSRKKLPQRCCVIEVSPLLRELILRAVAMGPLRRDVLRSIGGWSISCSISFASCPPCRSTFPMPRDTRALRVADPDSRRSWRTRDACDPRESCRRGTPHPGAGVQGGYRHDAGAMASASAIAPGGATFAAGESMTTTALEAGYDSTSAFE